jgi:hypothetical protein
MMKQPKLASFYGPNAEVYSAQDYEALAARVETLERQRRWNIERTDDGLRVCENDHHRSRDCEWTEYVPKGLLTEASGKLKAIQAAAGNVVWYDYSDCDEDVQAAITALENMVPDYCIVWERP